MRRPSIAIGCARLGRKEHKIAGVRAREPTCHHRNDARASRMDEANFGIDAFGVSERARRKIEICSRRITRAEWAINEEEAVVKPPKPGSLVGRPNYAAPARIPNPGGGPRAL
jgi:hypothetical protein